MTEIIEAIIFSSGKGIGKKDISEKLPEFAKEDLEEAIKALRQKYGETSGVRLIIYNENLQLVSNAKYGETVADVLTPIKEKELSKTLLEVLSIVAYKQPVTRLDIEEIRGVSSDYAVSILQKIGMITEIGRKEAVGRPVLFGTTDEFLKRFELESLERLPGYDALLTKIKELDNNYNLSGDSLYRLRAGDLAGEAAADDLTIVDELPDFLKDEKIDYVD